jgi:hypothetical protein
MPYLEFNIFTYAASDSSALAGLVTPSLAGHRATEQPCPIISKELHQALDLRASTRLLSGDLGNDGLGSKTVLGNFHDDGAMLVPHCNLHFVYQEFDCIGTPHGLRTNWDKSGALVTLDPSDVPTNQPRLP